jgi:hypothetical protein
MSRPRLSENARPLYPYYCRVEVGFMQFFAENPRRCPSVIFTAVWRIYDPDGTIDPRGLQSDSPRRLIAGVGQ